MQSMEVTFDGDCPHANYVYLNQLLGELEWADEETWEMLYVVDFRSDDASMSARREARKKPVPAWQPTFSLRVVWWFCAMYAN